jgi:hypothetical protein
MTNEIVKPIYKKSIFWVTGFGLLTAILWNIPGGSLILYPFTILGTWFHEIFHGFTAMILGGNFHQLVIFSNGSGYAEFSYSSIFLGNVGKAVVAAAGPIGPSFFGAAFIMASINNRATSVTLVLFSFLLIISTLIWVRPFFEFGFFITLLFAVVFTFIAINGNDKFKAITLQFIGIQAFMSVYLSIGYLFSSGAFVGGQQNVSDTQVIADNLLLPYWFWGFLILCLNVFMIYKSIQFILKKEGMRGKL